MKYSSSWLLSAALLCGLTASAQHDSPKIPKKKFIDASNMDLNYKPGNDFNLYASGTWIKNNPVPAKETRWGSFNVLRDFNINAVKNILIEDFTGHLCQNCPDAARELEAIHDVYGAQIIGLAIHVGNTFARPYPLSEAKFTYDFRSKWGEELDNLFNITDAGLPKGMINRIGYPNDHRKDKGQWLASVGDELNKEVIFGINISSKIFGTF